MPLDLVAPRLAPAEAPGLVEALRAREAGFQALAEAMPQLVWRTGPDGTPEYFNPLWLSKTGLTVEESVAAGWTGALHPDDRPAVEARWARARAQGLPFEAECRFRSKEGSHRWFLTRALALRGAGDAILGWIGTCTDIHEQKERLSAERLLGEASRLLASSLDLDETLQRAAAVALPELGDWSALDLIDGDELRRIGVAHVRPEKAEWAQTLARHGAAPAGEERVRRVIATGVPELVEGPPAAAALPAWPDEAAGRALRGAVGAYLVVPLKTQDKVLGALCLVREPPGTFTDRDVRLAERLGKRAALAIERVQLFARAQAAIAARDLFLSIASHELRTPITAMKMQSQMMRRRLDRGDPDALSPARIGRLVDQIERSIDRLTALVEEMLDISRINAGKLSIRPEPVDLAAILAEVAERFVPQFGASGGTLTVDAPGALPGCWDRGRIEQVLTNLLSNALRHAPGAPVRLAARPCGDARVEIEVADRGPGIAREDQARIFERFERLSSGTHTGGLGLGLYISRQIAEAHGGDIRVESEPAQGTTFVVTLPRESPAGAR